MNSDKSDVYEVLVDVPKHDKDGNPISFDSLSSGGARSAGGSIIAQYCNPRVPEPANVPESDREFDERLSREYDARRRREYDARRRREEEAEERRRKELEDLAYELLTIFVDKFVIPFTKEVIVPSVTELWGTKLKPEGKRHAQRLLRPKMSRPEVPQASGDTLEVADEIADPLATSQKITDHTTEISTVQEGSEDTPLADVIQIGEFQNRRSA